MRAFNARISEGDRAQDSRGQLRLWKFLYTFFIRNSNSKVGGLVLGIKYLPIEVHDRSDPPGILPTSDLRRHLSEPLWRSSLRNTPKFCRRINPHQRRSDSSRRTNSTQVSIVNDHLLDFVRTPTGAGLRPRLQLQVDFVRTPTGARLHPRLQLQVDFTRTPTGVRLRAPTASDPLRVFAVNDLLQISTTSGPCRILTVSLHSSFHYG